MIKRVHTAGMGRVLASAGWMSVGLFSLAGCSSTPDTPARNVPMVSGASVRPAPAADMSKPVALAGRDPLTWGDLTSAMSEIAGAQALEEAVLDRMVATRAAGAGINVTAEQIAEEQRLFVRTLADEAGMSERDAAAALERVRASRGLGPVRYNALLRRNSTLRALVAGDVAPTQEMFDAELAIATGPRYRVRIMTSSSQSALANAREQVLGQSGSNRSSAFGNLATSVSGDSSAARGGLIDGISPVDPAVPGVIRSTLPTLQPGDVSPVLVLDSNFALLLMEGSVSPLETDTADARERVRQRLTLRLQRLAMDRLARELIASADVTVLDESLAWNRQNATRR